MREAAGMAALALPACPVTAGDELGACVGSSGRVTCVLSMWPELSRPRTDWRSPTGSRAGRDGGMEGDREGLPVPHTLHRAWNGCSCGQLGQRGGAIS